MLGELTPEATRIVSIAERNVIRLVRVVVSLLSNAVKFSPNGAEVEVSVELCGPAVRVEVLDRGPGVAREYRDVIFEPFCQAEATGSRKKGGTGLGLAICRAIVPQHEGQMGVEDRAGGGSVFWFTVPARPAPQEAPP